jgi:hypothetical protein
MKRTHGQISKSSEPPHLILDKDRLRSLSEIYRTKSLTKGPIVLPVKNGRQIRGTFPYLSEDLNALNSTYRLYETLNEFVRAAPPGIYVYGFFDTGFGALQVKNYSEFLTSHPAVARRKNATKVYAAGELEKQPDGSVVFNVTSGSYSFPLIERGQRTMEELVKYVEDEFRDAGIYATPATNAAGTFITAERLPVLNENLEIMKSFGFIEENAIETLYRNFVPGLTTANSKRYLDTHRLNLVLRPSSHGYDMLALSYRSSSGVIYHVRLSLRLYEGASDVTPDIVTALGAKEASSTFLEDLIGNYDETASVKDVAHVLFQPSLTNTQELVYKQKDAGGIHENTLRIVLLVEQDTNGRVEMREDTEGVLDLIKELTAIPAGALGVPGSLGTRRVTSHLPAAAMAVGAGGVGAGAGAGAGAAAAGTRRRRAQRRATRRSRRY